MSEQQIRRLNLSNLTFEKYEAHHVGMAYAFKVNPLSCSNPEHFENYLKLSAIGDNAEGHMTTSVLVDNDGKGIAGYLSLRSSALIIEESTEPALEICCLAVNQEYEGNGIGSQLINMAMAIAMQVNEHFIGIRYILLAAEPKAVGFYKKNHFFELEQYYKMPLERKNEDCVPMMLRLY